MNTAKDRREAVLYTAWAEGWLDYKLDADQRKQSEMLWSKHDSFVACISRQRGKSYWACVEVTGFALRTPGAHIKYASKTQKSVLAIVEPIMREILADCPPSLKPTFDAQRCIWRWPNGSEMTAAGTDNKHYENLRGTKSHFTVKDEAGFFEDYNAVDAVLAPQTLTTGGITLEVSTPPESPAHPFAATYYAAMARGRAIHRTLYGHPRMTEAEIEAFISREAGKRGRSLAEFKQSTYFRREFMAEFVTEESRAAIPGWNAERHAALVHPVERPKYYDAYTFLDWGGYDGDPHAALFAWHWYEKNLLVFEDELVLRGATTAALAEAIKAKETALWGNNQFDGTLFGARDWGEVPTFLKNAISAKAPRQPYLRVGDNDPLVLADLTQLYGLAVFPTRKDDKHLAVDEVDVMVRRGECAIHPRCENLIRQLYGTTWNKARTEWERSADGHGDLIDCVVYGRRNVRKHRDPRPKEVDQWDYQSKPKSNDALANALGFNRFK